MTTSYLVSGHSINSTNRGTVQMNIHENRLEATVATIDTEMDKELQELAKELEQINPV